MAHVLAIPTACPGCLRIWRIGVYIFVDWSWWRHHMETFSPLLALCDRWIPLTKASGAELGCFLWSDKWLSKQSWGLWFETPSHFLWRHCNAFEALKVVPPIAFNTSGEDMTSFQLQWVPWWRHDIETLSALLAICEGNPPMSGAFPLLRTSNSQLWRFLYCWPE